MKRCWGFLVGLGHASLLVFLPACSEDAHEPEPGDECNDLVNDGPEVRQIVVGVVAPVPAGGTIALGTYELTAMNFYGVNPPVHGGITREVVEISRAMVESAIDVDGDVSRFVANFNTSGTDLTIEVTCPGQSQNQTTYTATPTELRIFDGAAEWISESVLSKR